MEFCKLFFIFGCIFGFGLRKFVLLDVIDRDFNIRICITECVDDRINIENDKNNKN